MDLAATLTVVIAGAAITGVVLLRWYHVRHVQAVWGGVATKLGLRPRKERRGLAALFAGPRAPISFAGQYAGFDVSVARHLHKKARVLTVDIDASSDIPSKIGFRRREARAFFGRRASSGALVLGDPAFDASVTVSGPERVVRALADASCRERVLRVFRDARQANVRDGRLSYQAGCRDVPAVIEGLFADGVALAQALCLEPAQVRIRLEANARSGDLAQIRIAALEALSQLRKSRERTRQITLALLDDPDPEVRAQAALRCEAADIDRLLGLAEREREPMVIVSLLGHLSSFAGSRLWPLIRESLRSGHDDMLRAAGEAALATGFTDAAADIARSLDLHFPGAGPETIASLVRALGVFRDSATEPVLVRVLSHEAKEVQRLAAAALAEFGSVAAVEALLERSERLLFDRDTKTALLTAVGRIQARAGVVEIGTLSLAEHSDEIGALSLAQTGAEIGSLSLVSSGAVATDETKANR